MIVMVFATSSLVNANTNVEVNIKLYEEIEAYDKCVGFAGRVARDYSNRGYDYWIVWFAAYGHCFDRTITVAETVVPDAVIIERIK